MDYTLDFEKPVYALENQIRELETANEKPSIDITGEIKALQEKVNVLIKEIYGNLSSWERVLLSRHPQRPHTIDYLRTIITDFHEVHGDRRFFDDRAMMAGFGYIDGLKVAVIGIEKGRKTSKKIERNFGMVRPEGYRKALRVMQLAQQFNIPIITLVDTPGAYPGIGAEERGQSHAIATNIAEMFDIKVPIVSVIIGEGGSGGALGIAVADRVLMMEYSVYSVISPESCASILWADPKKAESAANSLKLTPENAKSLGVIDDIIDEPPAGAHRDTEMAGELLKLAIVKELKELSKLPIDKLLSNRFDKFRKIGNTTIKNMDDSYAKQIGKRKK